MATNYHKFSFLASELPQDFFIKDKKYDIIDFGTGPGTYLLAFLDLIGPDQCHSIIGIDHNDLMLEQCQKVITGLFPESARKLILSKSIPEASPNRERLLLFGNSMNELEAQDVMSIIREVKPDRIIFIEPGTPPVYKTMMTIRSSLALKGYECLYPCLSSSSTCPVEVSNSSGGEDWCHQVWRGQHDSSIERLSQLLKLDRRSMPMIAHAYTLKNNRTEDESDICETKAQFIRFLSESKHAFHWQVCLQGKVNLDMCEFEIPKRSMDKNLVKEMRKTSVGTRVSFNVIKVLDEKRWRVEIKSCRAL